MAPDEKQLLEAARAGDRDACAEVVRAHYRTVYALLAHLSGDAHLAEDLTQDTFAAAWKGIGRFRGESSVATWFHKIAYGKFVDAKRRLRRCEGAGQVLELKALAEGATPEGGAIVRERRELIAEAVRGLDDEARDVIVLHYFQSLSFSDMAQVLGEPVGTVKWRTSRALERLRARLDGKV